MTAFKHKKKSSQKYLNFAAAQFSHIFLAIHRANYNLI